jgi:hypothetical protein
VSDSASDAGGAGLGRSEDSQLCVRVGRIVTAWMSVDGDPGEVDAFTSIHWGGQHGSGVHISWWRGMWCHSIAIAVLASLPPSSFLFSSRTSSFRCACRLRVRKNCFFFRVSFQAVLPTGRAERNLSLGWNSALRVLQTRTLSGKKEHVVSCLRLRLAAVRRTVSAICFS